MGEQAVLLSVDDFTLLFWVAGSCLRKGGGIFFKWINSREGTQHRASRLSPVAIEVIYIVWARLWCMWLLATCDRSGPLVGETGSLAHHCLIGRASCIFLQPPHHDNFAFREKTS